MGPDVMAGAGIGYGVDGPNQQNTFVTQYAGFKARGFKTAAIYIFYQHASVPGSASVGGDGGKAMLISESKHSPDWTLGVGLGFLTNIRGNPENGSLGGGVTFEGLLGYTWSEWLALSVNGNAWDRGDTNGDGKNEVSYFVHGSITLLKDVPW